MDQLPILDSYFQITPSDLMGTTYTLQQLEKLLRVDIKIGIDTKDTQDIVQRKKQYNYSHNIDLELTRLRKQGYGRNKYHYLVIKIVSTLKNKHFQLLFVVTIVKNTLTSIEIATDRASSDVIQQCIQSILLILFIIFLYLLNVFKIDNEYLLITKKIRQKYRVLRNSQIITIAAESVLVGDVLCFNENQLIEVDGMLIEEQEQQYLFDDQDKKIIKSGTKVLQGSGKLLVLAVGENTSQQQYRNHLLTNEYQTPLQERLEFLQEQLNEICYYIPFFIFLSLCTHYCYGLFVYGWPDQYFFRDILEYLQISLILELVLKTDLPLLISSYLYYNENKMRKNKIQFLRPSSCEILGRVNNIITSKTGILTDGQMKVSQIYAESQISSIRNLNYETIQILSENICLNSTACPRIRSGNNITIFEKIGNETECALLEYCHEIGKDYRQIRSNYKIVKQYDFTSDRKMMSTLIQHSKSMRLYTKGAPEIIIDLCTNYIGQKGEIEMFTQESKFKLKEVLKDFCSQGLRTICLAYRNIEMTQSIAIEKQLTFISLIGLEDQLRQGVQKSIQQCKEAGVIVRMVTNDNIHTAVSIAKKCGILPQNYQYVKGDLKVLTGTAFRELVKGITYQFEDGLNVPKVGDLDYFGLIAAELRVLARSTIDDKLALISGLRQLNYVVGAFSNEKEVFNLSDVGFCMGSKPKQASVCVLDNNFASIIYSLDWGRNVFDVSRKLIQFTLTHLISFTSTSVLCSLFLTKFPFDLFELLWATLLIDTFAFFAYSTDIPNQILMERQKHERHFLITSNMWRNIISQCFYQIPILLLIEIRDLKNIKICRIQNIRCETLFNTQEIQNYFFTTFIYLQIINLVISHKLHKTEFIFSNKMSVNIKIILEIIILLTIQYCTVTIYEHIISALLAMPALIIVQYVVLIKLFVQIHTRYGI